VSRERFFGAHSRQTKEICAIERRDPSARDARHPNGKERIDGLKAD
jgi:hypothetical protein